jgi:PAS domain S-box-containing protein
MNARTENGYAKSTVMNRYVTIAFAAIFLLIASTVLTGTVWAAEQPSLVFCGNANYPPMTYLENGKPKGLVVDIVRALEKQMGRPIEIRLVEWKEAQALVDQGKADAAVPMSITEPRRKLFDFSSPMYDVRLSIFVRKGKPGILTLSDLHGLKVGATSGSLAMQLVQADPQIKGMAMGDDLFRGFQMLNEGKLDAIVADYWVGHYILAEHGISGIQPVGEPVLRMSSTIAVKKGNQELLGPINAGIESLLSDGTLTKIRAKWEPKEIVVETREEVLRKTYSVVIGALVLVLVAGAFWVVTVKREIARRRSAEAEAKENEVRYRRLIEYAPDAIIVYDYDSDRLVDANPNGEKLLGCSREELLCSSLQRFLPVDQDDLKVVTEQMRQALAGKTPEFERRVRNASGREMPCEIRLVRLPHEKLRLIRASFLDITERKEMEEYLHRQALELEEEIAVRQVAQEALQQLAFTLEEEIKEHQKSEAELEEREGRLQAIFDGSPIGMFRTTLEGRFLQMNNAQAEMFGYVSPAEMMEQVNPNGSATLWVSPDTRLEVVAKATSANGRYIEQQVAFRRKDASTFDAVFYCMLTFDRDSREPYLLGFIQDLTERKKLEEQLHQSQKMESIGRLAGGVAHDFNNMLSVILGAAQLAMAKVPADGEIYQLLDAITMAAERSSGITRQLLAFSRKDAIVPKVIDLNAHVLSAQKSFGRLIGEDITFSFHPAQDLWPIKMDSSQLDQILMNLSVNARDAMPGGGALAMETSNVRVEGDFTHAHLGTLRGDYVLLSVGDTGCGMGHETLERIFEPFFTTKEIGKGTGLGLSTVYGIVTQNDGQIGCSSEVGRGTTFYVYLPRQKEGEAEKEKPLSFESDGTGVILLVEDEAMLIGIATKLLEQLGYTVIQAPSPLTAIAICKQEHRGIDMILTDVIMPEMNGKEMIDKIQLIRPGIKTLFMSGYPADIVTQRGIVKEGMHYIQKPLDIRRLREGIGTVLREKGDTPAEGPPPSPDAAIGGVQPDSLSDDAEVFSLFLAKAPEYLSHMQTGMREGELEKIQFFAHKLAGAAAAVGCHSIAGIAGVLDEMSEQREPITSIGPLIEELAGLLSALKARH